MKVTFAREFIVDSKTQAYDKYSTSTNLFFLVLRQSTLCVKCGNSHPQQLPRGGFTLIRPVRHGLRITSLCAPCFSFDFLLFPHLVSYCTLQTFSISHLLLICFLLFFSAGFRWMTLKGILNLKLIFDPFTTQYFVRSRIW